MMTYHYLGLRQNPAKTDVLEDDESPLKTIGFLRKQFIQSLKMCFQHRVKKEQWIKAIDTLESDANFADMNLKSLGGMGIGVIDKSAMFLLSKMSSGHTIVLLTITRLIEKVEEKTLVLIDEPESHLHPPLLAAFTRALSDLLLSRNGVAIIATHSPVILQEIPRSCAWKVTRFGKESRSSRPKIETFGENVGALTREVFGLEVEKSGFMNILKKSVEEGGTFDEIIEDYDQQIGYEGQVLLQTMIVARDRGNKKPNE